MIASTFYSGLFPIAPGTVGSAIAIAVLFLVPGLTVPVLITAAVVSYFIGIWAAAEAEKAWGHDAGKINWDEVSGMIVSVVFLPQDWMVYGAAFFVFRFFDILKPFPADRAQNLPGGWGVMTDDIIAGLYTNIVLQIVFRLLIVRI